MRMARSVLLRILLIILLVACPYPLTGQQGRSEWGVALKMTSALVQADRGANTESYIAILLGKLPRQLHYTAAIARANAAVARTDYTTWMECVNAFLAHYNTTSFGIVQDPTSCTISTDIISCIDNRASQLQVVPLGPLISVIMVAHNAASTIAAAVASVLAQTWQNLELIIVDDASTDDTWSTINHLQMGEQRVRLLRNRVRVGPYVSRNRALQQAARGSFITGHDADDWAHPARLESQVRVLLDSGGQVRANVAYMLRVKPDGRIRTDALSWFSPDGAAKISMVSAMFERRLLVEELGHWDSVHYGADAEMIARTRALLGSGFVEIPVISMLCRDTATGLGKSGYSSVDAGVQTSGDGPVAFEHTVRAHYRQGFKTWHALIASTGDAYLPFIHHPRRFHAPAGMAVDVTRVRLLAITSRKISGVGRTRPAAFSS
jgi:hypothetical protein